MDADTENETETDHHNTETGESVIMQHRDGTRVEKFSQQTYHAQAFHLHPITIQDSSLSMTIRNIFLLIFIICLHYNDHRNVL